LPFVRHPEYEDPLEEDWLHEAITETYLPLLAMMGRLERDGVPFRLTMTLSPPLLAMLEDELLTSRYQRRIESLMEFAEREVERTRFEPAFNATALQYLQRFREARRLFCDVYHRRLAGAFRHFAEIGSLEIITCTATHGYLPLMARREAVRAQVYTAVRSHQRILGSAPRGIWLAECGYVPGVDAILREAGLRYFFLDSHGLLLGQPRPRLGVFAPVATRAGVAAFGRDPESSKQVWSSREGYPGDPAYRDFYRDAGYDLDFDYVRPYIHSSGLRKFTGIKYYRITGPGDAKEPYDPRAAQARAVEHAGNFMFNRQRQMEYLAAQMPGRQPIVVAPYDAELYGHWWYEGPEFLEALFRKLHTEQNQVAVATPWEYLERQPRLQVVEPSASSWGYLGYHEVWLNPANDWIYRHLHKAADCMVELANANPHPPALGRRALNQAARELLLAQSSDWAFIMKTGTMVDYAVRRTREHIARFWGLKRMLSQGSVNQPYLAALEARDLVFPEMDFRVYRGDATF
jgi:1,4-alpha-glucan branching enzyme